MIHMINSCKDCREACGDDNLCTTDTCSSNGFCAYEQDSVDTDGDHVCDVGDNCPDDKNPGQLDGDSDGI